MKTIYTYLILFFALTGLSSGKLQAKQPAVRGKVTDEQLVGLEKVTVYLMSSKVDAIIKTAVTDAQGKFSIASVPSGTYFVQASSVGFATYKSEILTVNTADVIIENIILLRETNAIGEVTVQGRLPLVQQRDGKLILNVENSTLAAGNNALDIVQRAPGVSVDKDDNLQLMGQQGVNVTIDGRQTYMSGEQLTSLLKTMNGDQIKSVEVSTVRSAKDDAEGSVGTINIVLKKNNMEGFNGSFVVSGAKGIHGRGNSSLNLNYKKNNTNVFGSYGYTHDKRRFDIALARNIISETDPRLFRQSGAMGQLRKNHDYRFGVEHKTSSKNTVVLQFTGNNEFRDEENNSLTNIGPNSSVIDSILQTTSIVDNSFNRYSLNFNNEYLLDTLGGKLTFDGDWSRFRNNSINDYGYLTTDPIGTPLYPQEIEQSRAPVDIDILVGKIDYVKNVGKGKIEAGLKYSNVKSDNDLQFERYVDGQWEEYIGRPNHFVYTEQIAAAYADYSQAFGKFNMKLGLRGEYTFSDGNSITLNKRVKRDYIDLFPSASLGYNLNENHVLSLSYARKVQRPNYRSLNPFTYYIDKFTYSLGNPYLNPQYTDGFTLNYTLFKRFNLTLGTDITHDAIVESLGQNDETGESWVTSDNLAENITSYLNVNAPIQIGNFWTMNNNVAGIYMHFKGPISGEYANLGSFFLQGRSTNNFKVYKGWSAELSANYTSEFVYSVYRIHPRWGVDVGTSYNFDDKRSSLKLAVTDIFRTQKNHVSSDFGNFDLNVNQYNDSRTVRLTFTYKFGNLKQQNKRVDTVSEEKSRAQ
ncbi:TonB-dependent receptor [Sphingobacterium shayense]|uniref:outer membrane beta-barrel family protein n=1 Tax=Sphingobacterium shayense TaxID=626343 RepID=UPI001555A67A|nr:outer membrane beta-barrel family protein [Sphingobacterium shayense]NQD71767.1 TonB-dependent receptor [Sphingobacterium shayense]